MQLKNLGLVNDAIKKIGKSVNDIGKIKEAVKDLNAENTAAVLVTTKLSEAEQFGIMVSKESDEAKAQQILANASLSASNNAATASTHSFSAAIQGLGAAIKANPIGFAITIITSLISAITHVINKVKEAEAEALESAKRLKQEYSDLFSSLDNNISTLKGLEDEFKRLSAGVGDYGENISLTGDEYERYQEIVQTIVGISPELIAGYDNEGNAIANKNGLLEQSIALMREEQRIKKAEMLTDENLWKFAKINIEEIKKLQDDFDTSYYPLANFGTIIDDATGKITNFALSHYQLEKAISSVIGVEKGYLESMPEYFANNIDEIYKNIGKIIEASGQDVYFNDVHWKGFDEREQESLRQYILEVKSHFDDVNDEVADFNKNLQLIPESMTEYDDLSNGSKDFLSRWIRSFKIDADTTEQEIALIPDEIEDFTKELSKDSDLQNVVDLGIRLGIDYNSSELSVEDYKQEIQKFLDSVSGLSSDIQAKIRLAFEFDGNDTEWEKQVETKVERVKNILIDKYDNEVSKLSMQELEIAYNISASENSLTFAELIREINKINIPTYDKIYNSFSGIIDKLRTAIDEQRNYGAVSANTYNQVTALNKDYADLFDFSSGKISIVADEVDNLTSELIDEYGATLAANGATDEQIGKMVALAASLSDAKAEADALVDTIEDLVDILQDAVDGTEMNAFETYELCNKYPELIGAITKTTNGYILEAKAVKELIRQKALLLKQDATDTRIAARETLIKNAGNVDSANNVDKIFADYYNKNGKNIKSLEEYTLAWEDYYGKTKTGEWIQGLQEYVSAIISDNFMNGLIEDMKDPDSLLEQDENPISDAFDELEAVYSGRLKELDYLTSTYNNAIKSLENQGYDVPASYYEKLKEVEEEKIALLGEELTALTDKFREAINAGEIKEGSKEFYDMNDAVNSVKEAIQESGLALQEYSNAIRDIEWKKFDDVQAEIKKITDEAEFLLDLLDNKDMVDKAGKLSEYGSAAMGLHGVNYNVYAEQAKRYADEIAKIEQELAGDENNKHLIERKEELLDLQRESVLAAEEEKQAMVDLIEEGIEAELDALDELIEKYKDSLDSAKDLYDYQNKVSDITSEVSTLQKQIIAYENDTSEEAKAQIQKLKVDLQEAQEELQETEYDRFIADQKTLLDNLYDDYETILNRRLDDVDALIADSIDAINTNTDKIKATIEATAGSVGIALSGKMNTIWAVTDEAKQVLTDYSEDSLVFAGLANGSLATMSSEVTTIGDVLSTIDDEVLSSGKHLSNIDTAIDTLAPDLAAAIAPLIEHDNSGDAENPTADNKGNGGDVTELAPNVIYTDPNDYTFGTGEQTQVDTLTESDNGNGGKEAPTQTYWTSYKDALAAGFGNILGSTEKERQRAEKQYGSYQKYLDAMYHKYVGNYDRGVLDNGDYYVSHGKSSDSSDEYKVTIGTKTYEVATFNVADDVFDAKLDAELNGLFGGEMPPAGTLAGFGGTVYIVSKQGHWQGFANKNDRDEMTKAYFARLNAYKDGGLADFTGLAWVDGTKSKPEMVLDAEDTRNFIALRDVLAQLASDNVSFGNPLYSSFAPMSYGNNVPNFDKKLAQILNSYGETKVENNFEITIPIEKVEDYNDFVTKLQKDGKFEKMIRAMTVDQLTGGSPLAKYNYSWKNK